MEKVGELSHLTINLLKKFVACAIRDSFYRNFQLSCLPSWKDIPVDVLCSSMSIVRSELPSVLENPHIFFKGSESTGVGDRILDYRLHHNGHMPTRLKCLFSWNLNSWQSIESCDYKLRKIRKLLRSGPVCLQETKWHGSHSDMALQNLSGVCICSSDATISDNGEPMGGVAILLPPGTVLIKETELVKGRAIAALIQDRTISYYVISIYLRPGEKKQNVEQIIRAWSHVEKRSDHVFIAGDFNRIDTEYPELWTKLLDTFGCVDVDPDIVTYHFPGGQSKLDRVLVPEEYVTAAKLNPRLVTIPSHLVNGHEILKLKLMVKPSVISHPSHPKHLTIPSGVFIRGKTVHLYILLLVFRSLSDFYTENNIQLLILSVLFLKRIGTTGITLKSRKTLLLTSLTMKCRISLAICVSNFHLVPHQEAVLLYGKKTRDSSAVTYVLIFVFQVVFGLGGDHNPHRSIIMTYGLTVVRANIFKAKLSGSMFLLKSLKTSFWLRKVLSSVIQALSLSREVQLLSQLCIFTKCSRSLTLVIPASLMLKPMKLMNKLVVWAIWLHSGKG